MCAATLADGQFDPLVCPLLAKLSPEERARRLAEPWVAACIARRKTTPWPDHQVQSVDECMALHQACQPAADAVKEADVLPDRQ